MYIMHSTMSLYGLLSVASCHLHVFCPFSVVMNTKAISRVLLAWSVFHLNDPSSYGYYCKDHEVNGKLCFKMISQKLILGSSGGFLSLCDILLVHWLLDFHSLFSAIICFLLYV